MQYPTCRHIKEDGAYCGSPSLKDRKYCYYHLEQRGRRFRQARAQQLSAYRFEIPSLDNLYALRTAVTEIVNALGSGQLDQRVAGKMLYGIQQVSSFNRRIAEAEAAAAQSPAQAQAADDARVQEYPGFEQEFGMEPGQDIDAQTEWAVRRAGEQVDLRQANHLPMPPSGVRLSPAQYQVYREESYQILNLQVNRLQRELRDYHDQKRKQHALEIERLKQEMLSSTPPPNPKPEQGGPQGVISKDSAPKKPVASTVQREQEATRSA
jgi:hypothetical protein